MGALLGVSKGSKEKPRFIVMEYQKGGKEKPIVLVGKGVTFDTGGLSLKPSDSMLGMHMDMSGGAVVVHTLALIGKLKLKRNVIGLVPAVENMPSGESYRPGDILTSMSGKTIEVLNTDAEGRLILADALTYAERYKPYLVVDVATLTGAALVALGERCSAFFTKEQKLQNLLLRLAEETGEYVWPLPLWDEYEEEIKGYFADLSNIHRDNSRWGSAIQGAIFLYQFAKSYPWVHIDMTPRMVSIKSDYLAKGATGEPMKLLLKLVEEKNPTLEDKKYSR
ncbi:MAG: leucyl aminopeptidase [Parcubacteria group bacterium Gr01-1014_107]|nr:MAG: leucyl aminopeptidase [Parcubacteria group bacterium Gr01-1014_107]